MSTREIQELAKELAEQVCAKIKEDGECLHRCVFSDEEIAHVRRLVEFQRDAKRTAITTAIGAIVVAALSALGLGVLEWVRRMMSEVSGK